MSDGEQGCHDCAGTGWKSPVDYPHPNAKLIDLVCWRCHGTGLDLASVAVEPVVAYDRDTLVQALVYHWPTASSGCGCGWAVLGSSYPEHVADVYEWMVLPT